MKRLTLGIVGIGHVAKYHLLAIDNLNRLFDLVGVYDIDETKLAPFHKNLRCKTLENLLEFRPNCCVISTPSKYRYETATRALKNGVNVLLEKPFVSDLDQLDDLINIASLTGNLIHGATHARYASGSVSIGAEIEASPSETHHPKLGRLKKVILNRFDPYITNNQVVNYAPEKSSGVDSWPNILSELDIYVKDWSVSKVKRSNSGLLSQVTDSSTYIWGNFPGGIFEGHTDWTLGKNQKDTTLIFENGEILLDHSLQTNTYKAPLINTSKSFSAMGDRLEVEYFRMYEELYQVLNKVTPPNIQLVTKIVASMENMLKN